MCKKTVFEIFGIENKETKVSNYFRYVFETNKEFLNAFLKLCGIKEISDNEHYFVEREYFSELNNKSKNYIDILILINSETKPSRCICIENKIYAEEGPNQTKRYETILEKDFPDCKKKDYIYLTKNNSYINPTSKLFKVVHYKDMESICKSFSSIPYLKDFHQFYIQRDLEIIKEIEAQKKTLDMLLNENNGQEKLVDYFVYKFNTDTKDILCSKGAENRNNNLYFQITKDNWYIKNGSINIHLEGSSDSINVHVESNPYKSQKLLTDSEKEQLKDARNIIMSLLKEGSCPSVFHYIEPRNNTKLQAAKFCYSKPKIVCQDYYEDTKKLVKYIDNLIRNIGIL